MSDPITLTEAERESVESTLRWHFNVVAEDGKDSAYISVGIANALRRVESIIAARLAEGTAERDALRARIEAVGRLVDEGWGDFHDTEVTVNLPAVRAALAGGDS